MQFEFNDKNELKFKIFGGIIDLKFFMGCKHPEIAIQKYHLFINGFAMMPFCQHQAIIDRIKLVRF